MVQLEQVTITSIEDEGRRRVLKEFGSAGRQLSAAGLKVEFEVSGVTKDDATAIATDLNTFMSDSSAAGLAGVLTAAGVPVSSAKGSAKKYIPWFSPGSASFWAGVGGIVLIVVLALVGIGSAVAGWRFRKQIGQMLNRETFTGADTDGDGVLDANEIRALMKKQLGKDFTIDQIKAVMRKYDEDGDCDTLTFEEYQVMLKKWQKDGMKVINKDIEMAEL